MAVRLAAGWMAGVVPDGVVVVGPSVEIEIAAAPEPAAAELAAALASGEADPELLELLAAHGALGADPPPRPGTGVPLADAIGADPVPAGLVWTAEEALSLPPGASPGALRAFVAGLRPAGRLAAYALLWLGRGALFGDVPAPGAVERAARRTAGEEIVALELGPGGRSWRAPLDGIVGAGEEHRLGPVLRLADPRPVDPALPELSLAVAEIPPADLAAIAPARERLVQGTGAPDRARLVARAEAAERHAAAAPAAGLVTARRAELEGAIDPASLFANAAADLPRPWARVAARDGSPRWAPAETVHLMAGEIPWTSSGLAAHLDAERARDRALRELVERDAFMWTWLNRVGRERIAGAIPDDAARMSSLLATDGWRTCWVNLSLDTLPVVLCALTHPAEGLVVGAACAPGPVEALRRATTEAFVHARLLDVAGPPPRAEDVRGPFDHARLHRTPERRADHEFLTASPDTIALGEIPAGGDLDALLAAAGFEPLHAELTLPSSAPFRVVRALVPGLVPLTFGHGNEPVGLPRLATPLETRDGRRVEPSGDPAASVPHPFP